MKTIIAAVFFWALPCVAAAQDSHILQDLPPDTVVAVIDGVNVTLAEVDTVSRSQDPRAIFQLNQQLHSVRERVLSGMIEERLLAKAAKEAGMTVEDYVSALPVDPIDEQTVEAMVTGFISRNPNADAEMMRPLARQHLLDQKRADARKKHINQLKLEHKNAGSPIVMKLQPPRLRVPVDPTDPTKGNGPIEIIEFSDFECPYCQRAQLIIRELLARYDGKVKLVWKDFPLPNHSNAVNAAMAARCAQEQGKFWQYHDVLFSNQQALLPVDLRRHAVTVGLDLGKFDICIGTGKYQKSILADMKDHPVQVTPTFLINGRMVQGAAGEEIAAVIDQELGSGN